MSKSYEAPGDDTSHKPYGEDHETKTAWCQNKQLPVMQAWMKDPSRKPDNLMEKQYKAFI